MDNDKLSIISFNSSRRGLSTLSPKYRTSYLQELFQLAEPDICFLPGDDKTAKLNVIRGYGQFTIPHDDDTVLLYNKNRVEMKEPQFSLNAFGHMPGLDFDKLVVAQVEVSTLQPYKRVVKEFSIVSWKFDLFESASVTPEILTESIVKFSQCLAAVTMRPVIIGGEMQLDDQILSRIVQKLSVDEQEEFLANVQPLMSKLGYLPSMTESSLSDLQRLFMMKVYKCKPSNQNGIVKTYQESGNVADCFICSKHLHLTKASLLDLEEVTGREVTMPLLKQHKPTITKMEIPVRPPKHHGG